MLTESTWDYVLYQSLSPPFLVSPFPFSSLPCPTAALSSNCLPSPPIPFHPYPSSPAPPLSSLTPSPEWWTEFKLKSTSPSVYAPHSSQIPTHGSGHAAPPKWRGGRERGTFEHGQELYYICSIHHLWNQRTICNRTVLISIILCSTLTSTYRYIA